MLAEIGFFILILNFFIAIFQIITGLIPLLIKKNITAILYKIITYTTILQFILILSSFFILIFLFINSDFSIKIIFENSHTQKSLLYKISAIWGNHEGSIFLFALIISFLNVVLIIIENKLNNKLILIVFAIQSMLFFTIIGFIIFTSNPFERLFYIPLEGNNLNPLLQDIALVIHPPLLYFGYVGLSIPFSFSIAVLLNGKINKNWPKLVRPWILFAWICLTSGITTGSFWAYYELGWGGFWFWDPVENISLMPWMAATALLHSIMIMEKRNILGNWSIFLAILAFGLSLLGIFLVRSGLLISAHTFAIDSKRGIVLLAILTYFIGGAFILYFFRSHCIKQRGNFLFISKEGALLFNNLLISIMLVTVFIGTLYPLFIDIISDNKISVGAPFFNQTFIPLSIILLSILPIGIMLPWKKGNLKNILYHLLVIFLFCFIIILIWFYITDRSSILAGLAMMLGIWLIISVIWEMLYFVKFGQIKWYLTLKLLFKIKRIKFAVMLSHIGIGVMILGLSAMSAWRIESVKYMNIGDKITVGDFDLKFKNIRNQYGNNYNEIIGDFEILLNNKILGTISTAKRRYLKRDFVTTEVGLYNYYLGQIYISFGYLDENNDVQLRAYYNPLVLLIWIGPFLMIIGGLLALIDKLINKFKFKNEACII